MAATRRHFELDYGTETGRDCLLRRAAIVITISWLAWTATVLYRIWTAFFRYKVPWDAGNGILRSISLLLRVAVGAAIIALFAGSRRFSWRMLITLLVITLLCEVAFIVTPIMVY